MKEKEYALYKGDELRAIGTLAEISKQTGLKHRTLLCYKAPSRFKRDKTGKSSLLYKLEDEEEN